MTLFLQYGSRSAIVPPDFSLQRSLLGELVLAGVIYSFVFSLGCSILAGACIEGDRGFEWSEPWFARCQDGWIGLVGTRCDQLTGRRRIVFTRLHGMA